MFVGAAGSTGAVGAELAFPEPPAFVAVTRTRMVEPISSSSSSYVASSPPESGAQLEPDSSQRCHSYAYDVGAPLHVPVLALRS